jgi:hypothetical protein
VGHGFNDISHGNDPSRERDLVTSESKRVSTPIEALMVMVRNLDEHGWKIGGLKHICPSLGVSFHELEFSRIELA